MIDITKVEVKCKGGVTKVYDVPSTCNVEAMTKQLQDMQDDEDKKVHPFKLKEK